MQANLGENKMKNYGQNSKGDFPMKNDLMSSGYFCNLLYVASFQVGQDLGLLKMKLDKFIHLQT